MPDKVLAVALSIPNKQHQVLQAMLISTAAKELALSNPLLFILLILEAEKQNLSEQDFKGLVKEKRVEILKYLSLPVKPSVARLLVRTKIAFEHLKDLDALPVVLNDPKFLQLIQHVKQPCIQHFLFMTRYTATLTTNLLNLITSDTTSEEADHILRVTNDCWRMGMQLNQLNAVSCLAELDALHDRLVVRYNLVETDRLEIQYRNLYGAFPKPPLPGNKIIIPLTSWSELIQEGRKMKHCVSSYHYRINIGQVFIYQAHTNKRLTVALVARDNYWVLDEIRGTANTNPTEEDLEMIHKWYFEVTNKDKKS